MARAVHATPLAPEAPVGRGVPNCVRGFGARGSDLLGRDLPEATESTDRTLNDETMEDGMEKPRHKHVDCPGCEFLGGMPCEEKWIDMYCCGDVIVLRWGDCEDEELGGNSVELSSFDWDVLAEVRDEISWWPAAVEARRRSQLN
jgi:hypothetical protein